MNLYVVAQAHLFRVGMSDVLEVIKDELDRGQHILNQTNGDTPVWFRDLVTDSRPVLPIDSLLVEAYTFHTNN